MEMRLPHGTDNSGDASFDVLIGKIGSAARAGIMPIRKLGKKEEIDIHLTHSAICTPLFLLLLYIGMVGVPGDLINSPKFDVGTFNGMRIVDGSQFWPFS
jgi:hypothetical protein